uniref:Uncharacterized protein n=1 Tax=Arundo donax TaxID=35708 RepID=A0A0A9H7C9_ARUDO
MYCRSCPCSSHKQVQQVVAHNDLRSSLLRCRTLCPCTPEIARASSLGSYKHLRLQIHHSVCQGQLMCWCRRSQPQQGTPRTASLPLCSKHIG